MASDSQADRSRRTLLRQGLLLGGVAAAGALTGGALAYKRRDDVAEAWQRIRGLPSFQGDRKIQFQRNAARIRAGQARQTRDTVKQLKARYESPVLGKMRVWDMIEKLGICTDPSDDTLMLTSQYVHVQQILEAMERDNVDDRDQLLIALLHDIGKVMLLGKEAPEHIVGYTAPIGEFPRGAGLDNVVFQFGHDEMLYSRLKDHVPDHISWAVRYHSSPISVMEPYMNQRDRDYYYRYLSRFQPYDQGSKSHTHLPRVDMNKYRALIEDLFPNPILV